MDSNVTIGMKYFYRVQSMTTYGRGGSAGPVEVQVVTVPGVVRDLGSAFGNGMVILTWSAPEDDGGSPILEYIIHRGVFLTGMVEVAHVSTSNYTDIGLDNGLKYFYTVTPVNDIGYGTESDPIVGTPLGLPASPGLFKAEAKDDSVVLTWVKPVGTDRAPVTGYRVLRAMGDRELVEIAQVGDVTLYVDEDVKEGKRYTYQVIGISEIGEGEGTSTIDIQVKIPDEGPGFTFLILLLAFTVALTLKRLQ
jgi:hypothetical protein